MQEQQDTHSEKSKAIRLVEYLAKVARLRTKLIRDVDEYAHRFWVGGIPKQKGCYTQAWGPNEDFAPDVWIEVQNQHEPELPRIPPMCEEWVERSARVNTCDLPTLQAEITSQVENPARQTDSGQPEFISYVDSIEDHPEVRTEWDTYVEERWIPWAEKHAAWEAAHKTYAALFAIHQEQLRLGEEYELVLGIGLLRWQTPSGQRVRRHWPTPSQCARSARARGRLHPGR